MPVWTMHTAEQVAVLLSHDGERVIKKRGGLNGKLGYSQGSREDRRWIIYQGLLA